MYQKRIRIQILTFFTKISPVFSIFHQNLHLKHSLFSIFRALQGSNIKIFCLKRIELKKLVFFIEKSHYANLCLESITLCLHKSTLIEFLSKIIFVFSSRIFTCGNFKTIHVKKYSKLTILDNF